MKTQSVTIATKLFETFKFKVNELDDGKVLNVEDFTHLVPLNPTNESLLVSLNSKHCDIYLDVYPNEQKPFVVRKPTTSGKKDVWMTFENVNDAIIVFITANIIDACMMNQLKQVFRL